MKKDYYEILGIDKGADAAAIKKATADTFELVDKFYAGGQSYDVTYHFTKN